MLSQNQSVVPSNTGVDVAAVKTENDGAKKLYLFSVKSGDLTRSEWNGPHDQALRPSLDEILDGYLHSRVLEEHQSLDIEICLVFGGEIREDVRQQVSGYIEAKTTDKISIKEWNGEKLATLILENLLREELLPEKFRTDFRRALAMVHEPEVSIGYFESLLKNMFAETDSDERLLTSFQQAYLCLWIIYVWSRDEDNLEVAYLGSEKLLLASWRHVARQLGKKIKVAKSLTSLFYRCIDLHLLISQHYLGEKILPHTVKQYGLSLSVNSMSPLDVNLKLFELIGRLALHGIWQLHFAKLAEASEAIRASEVSEVAKYREQANAMSEAILKLIYNNTALYLPITDRQTTDITLALLLFLRLDVAPSAYITWFRVMVARLEFTISLSKQYTTSFTNYADLTEHPKDNSEEYFKDATAGSMLIPSLSAWLTLLKDHKTAARLADLSEKKFTHCTMQLWFPDEKSEIELYSGGQFHGVAVPSLPITNDGKKLRELLRIVVTKHDKTSELSAIKNGIDPIVLMACRHYSQPIPPSFWFPNTPEDSTSEAEQPSAV